ncbi:MAG: hypothetical protein WCL11_18630 [Verrucomicrobiota bacterium]
MNYFRDLQYPLFADLKDLMGEILQEQDLLALFQTVAWVILCFAPRGTQPPDYEPEDLEDNLSHQLDALAGWRDGGLEAAFSDWLGQSRQPELLTIVMALTLSWLEKAPPELRGRGRAKGLMIAALGAVVDTLDEAAREG